MRRTLSWFLGMYGFWVSVCGSVSEEQRTLVERREMGESREENPGRGKVGVRFKCCGPES